MVIVVIAIGVSFIILGFIGMLFGNIIKAAISRQREYMADAYSVQFTRYPESLASALEKIRDESMSESKNHLNNPKAEQASHMFFSEAVSKFETLFATHPPIDDRIAKARGEM